MIIFADGVCLCFVLEMILYLNHLKKCLFTLEVKKQTSILILIDIVISLTSSVKMPHCLL